MCGRAAQTYYCVAEAAKALGVTPPPPPPDDDGVSSEDATGTTSNISGNSNNKLLAAKVKEDSARKSFSWKDNYNLSPGMDAYVIRRNNNNSSRSNAVQSAPSSLFSCDRMVWGLVTQHGTTLQPLPPRHSTERMGLHFNNNMFNARSDTLLQKPTFCRLLSATTTTSTTTTTSPSTTTTRTTSSPQTCLVMVRGYFEWKTELKQKQPYFVYAANQPYLLMAGLWNTVSTGITSNDSDNEDSDDDDTTLSTFCMLTTDAIPCMQWLHHRMPLCIWDSELAYQWLQGGQNASTNIPLATLLDQLEQANIRANDRGELKYHAVTRKMTNLQFRDAQAIQAIPKPQSVTSFFAVKPSAAISARITSNQTVNSGNNGHQAAAAIHSPELVLSHAAHDAASPDQAATSSSNYAAKPDAIASLGGSASSSAAASGNPYATTDSSAARETVDHSIQPNAAVSYDYDPEVAVSYKYDSYDNASVSTVETAPDAVGTTDATFTAPASVTAVLATPPSKNNTATAIKTPPMSSTKSTPKKKSNSTTKAQEKTPKKAAAKSPAKAKKPTAKSPTKAKKPTAKSPARSPAKPRKAAASRSPDFGNSKKAATPDKSTSSAKTPPKKIAPTTTKSEKLSTPIKTTPPPSKRKLSMSSPQEKTTKTTKTVTTKITSKGYSKTTKVTTTTTSAPSKRPAKKAKTDTSTRPITSFFSPKKSPK